MNEHIVKKVEFQVKPQCTVETSKEEEVLKKSEDCGKNFPVKANINPVTPAQCVPDTRQNSRELIGQSNREVGAGEVKPQAVELELNVNKRGKAEAEDPKRNDLAKRAAAAKDKQNGMMNGAMKGQECALMSSHRPADISKTQNRPTAEGIANGGSQLAAVRPSVTSLALGHPNSPVIKLESLDVKGDEVQSMEVR